MSVRVSSWVWDNATTVGGNDLLVLLALADHTDDTGANAWPSIATLARKTRINERTVQRIIRRLTEAGHLLVDATTGGRRSNRYTVVMAQPTTAPSDACPPDAPVSARLVPPAAGASYPHPRPQPPAPRHSGGPPPRHDATAPPSARPPQPRHSRAARTSLTLPRNTQRAARRTGAAPPDRCPHHLGQSAHNCSPCRSEQVGAG